MRFYIAKEDLVNILNTVSKGMSSRSTLPILAGVLLDANDDKVTFQTTDLEVSIKHTALASVEEPGRTVIPGKLFGDIVKSLPDAAICVATDGERVSISCLDSSFSLSTLNPMDFPYFPNVEAERKVDLESKQLADVVRKVGKAVSRDEGRAILTGILFSVEGTMVRFAATDSYRLAVAEMELEQPVEEGFQAIIPGKIFEDVSKLASGYNAVTVAFSENQIMFTFGSTVLVSRKIEGTYPNYRQLLPKEVGTTVRLKAAELTSVIKRVALLAQAHTPVRFSFNADEQKVTISAKTQDVGDARETMAATIEGESMDIAFNHQYLLDGLSCVNDEAVLELQTSLKPGIVKCGEDDGFIYLAMPVRLN